jgi:hypothetical protein
MMGQAMPWMTDLFNVSILDATLRGFSRVVVCLTSFDCD